MKIPIEYENELFETIGELHTLFVKNEGEVLDKILIKEFELKLYKISQDVLNLEKAIGEDLKQFGSLLRKH